MKNLRLCDSFLWMGFNCLKATEPLWRDTTQSPWFPATHLVNFDGMKGWNNLDFETTQGGFESGAMYWESSILTTREIGKTYLKCKCTVFTNIKQILFHKISVHTKIG